MIDIHPPAARDATDPQVHGRRTRRFRRKRGAGIHRPGERVEVSSGPRATPAVQRIADAQRTARIGRSLSLAAADGFSLFAALRILSLLRRSVPISTPLLIAGIWMILGGLVYEQRGRDVHLASSTIDEFPSLLQLSFGATAAVELFGSKLSAVSAFALLTSLFVSACAAHVAVNALWRRVTGPERLILVSGGHVLERFKRKIELEPTVNAQLVASVDPLQEHEPLSPDALAKAVNQVAVDSGCDRIVVGADDVTMGQLRGITQLGRRAQLRISVLPTVSGAIGSRARLGQMGEWPTLEFHCRGMSHPAALVKRVVDVAVSAIGLVAMVPLFVAIAAAIKIDDRGPVLFRQVRGGTGGQPFSMWKFRTMATNAEDRLIDLVDFGSLVDPMYKVKQDPRVTQVGKALRRTSLDELPQLLNVFRGDMSLVGPRPEDYRLVQRYDADALAIRCGMRPGITGPMQVHGRGDLTFTERLHVEREYLENYSLVADMRILALTIGAVFAGRRGAY